jgi:hypothetical protein
MAFPLPVCALDLAFHFRAVRPPFVNPASSANIILDQPSSLGAALTRSAVIIGACLRATTQRSVERRRLEASRSQHIAFRAGTTQMLKLH